MRPGDAGTLRVALAALRQQPSVPAGVERIRVVLRECAEQHVEIVCTPETYLPGLRGLDFDLPDPDQETMEQALRELRQSCRDTGVALIIGMEWLSALGLENRAVVVSADGTVLGHQTKNQITPGGESEHYVPDGTRRVFTINGLTFGIVICHEGWRYPETVRWAATRGAQVVFQPQVTGSDKREGTPREWGASFYEKAMVCRAQENSIYFASVNQAMRAQNSATSLISPTGDLVADIPCGEEGLLVADLDIGAATRFYAERYRPEWYPS